MLRLFQPPAAALHNQHIFPPPVCLPSALIFHGRPATSGDVPIIKNIPLRTARQLFFVPFVEQKFCLSWRVLVAKVFSTNF